MTCWFTPNSTGKPTSCTKVRARYNSPNLTSPRKRPYATVNNRVEAHVIACPSSEIKVLLTTLRSMSMYFLLCHQGNGAKQDQLSPTAPKSHKMYERVLLSYQ